MPEISIITPFYNSEKYIEKCISSVTNQSFSDFELILINDGSIDNSEKIVKKFSFDKRIRLFSKENEGQGVARNFALDKTSGNIILYLDSDDWLEENALYEIVEKFKKNNPDILIFNTYKFFEETQNKNEYRFIDSYFLKFGENNFSPKETSSILFDINALPFKAYKKGFLVKNNIKYSNTRFIEDSEFFIKSFLYAEKICCLDKYLMNYRIHKNSITFTQNNRINTIKDTFYVCENILKNSDYFNNEEIVCSFLNNRIRQLFYYYTLCNKKFKKEYFYMFKSIVKHIYKTYGLNFIEKNTQFIRLRNIDKESYEIYELKKRILRIKLFMKHYF